MSKYLYLCIVFSALIAFDSRVSAQVLYGSLTGNVTDPNGATVPGASLQLTSLATGAVLSARTEDNGVFHFDNIQSGPYEFPVRCKDFRIFAGQGLTLSPTRFFASTSLFNLATAGKPS